MTNRDEYEGHLTDQDLRGDHPDTADRWRDPDGHEAMQYRDDIERTRKART